MAESSSDYTDPGTLERLYHGEGLSTTQIGEKFDVSPETIRSWMEKHGIERRDKTEGKSHRNADTLRRLYHEEDKSAPQIAEELGVSHTTIYEWLDKHGIDTRDHSASQDRQWDVLFERPELLEYDDWLTWRQTEVIDLVIHQGQTPREAAERLDVDPETVRTTLRLAAERLRSVAEEQSDE